MKNTRPNLFKAFQIGVAKDLEVEQKRIDNVMAKVLQVLEDEKVNVIEMMEVMTDLQFKLSLKLKKLLLDK